MKRLNFSISINAPATKVWEALWDDNNYREWTSVFCEGSYVETDWNEGSKALFLSPGGEGMYSTIAINKPNEVMSFRHIGMVKDGKELPIDDATRSWSGAEESYYLRETDGQTELTVEMDITEEHAAYFNDAFPKGLEKIKSISES
ncbi:MAG TPA: SRPBCC domain-containing protein [Flavobacterium sp.]|jgi:hypothetical protein